MAGNYDITYLGSDAILVYYTIFIIYKLIRRVYPSATKGELLFCALYHRRKYMLLIGYLVLIAAYVGIIGVMMGGFTGPFYRKIVFVLPMLWIFFLLLPDRVYSNGIEEYGTFYTWQELDSIEKRDNNNYKVTLNTGRRLYMRLRDGDTFPYMQNRWNMQI